MHKHRVFAAAALAAVLTGTTAACGGGSTTSGSGGNSNPKTLTYWASNQGASLENDKQVLTPELKKFQQQTGITVKLEVVPWADLLNRILAATTSGQGPDVLNIGNTWSASLQATGALLPWDSKNLAEIGGKDRFAPAALAAAGVQGKDPAAVPLYSMAYGLYWNKKMFAAAGTNRSAPPTSAMAAPSNGSSPPVACSDADHVLPMLRTSGPWPEVVAARMRLSRSVQGTTSSSTLMPVCFSNLASSGFSTFWSAAMSVPWLLAQ
jgi:maltose-binding protein MalE